MTQFAQLNVKQNNMNFTLYDKALSDKITVQGTATMKKMLANENRLMVSNAKKYGIKCHRDTNHRYDGRSYRYHLTMVHDFFNKYSYLIKDHEDFFYAKASCFTHDTIEDARQTLNDVIKACGVKIGELSYALSNEKGRVRDERANAKYYADMRKVPLAPFVKICDRLANAAYSSMKKGKMYDGYAKELDHFEEELFDEKYAIMFDELRKILNK
jgi:(p)ppGpp synthase/HD superfamily hydrolase